MFTIPRAKNKLISINELKRCFQAIKLKTLRQFTYLIHFWIDIDFECNTCGLVVDDDGTKAAA